MPHSPVIGYRRVFGLEIEHSATGREYLAPTPLNRTASRSMGPHWARNIASYPGIFLPNGGRWYLDNGTHPEYATPECDDIEEFIYQVQADEVHAAEQVNAWLERIKWRKLDLRPRLYSNNITNYGGDEEESIGTHENYQFWPHFQEQKIEDFARQLIPYLVSRIILFGSGRVTFTPEGRIGFQLSERADFFNRVASWSTKSERGILNTRDEALAYDGSRRLHVILTDNLVLSQLTGLRAAIMKIFLCMLEEGHQFGVELCDPVGALHQINADPTVKVDVVGRRKPLTGLDLQKMYDEQIRNYVFRRSELRDLTPWLNDQGGHLDRLAADLGYENHVGHLDWANKKDKVYGAFRGDTSRIFPREADGPRSLTQGKIRALVLAIHRTYPEDAGEKKGPLRRHIRQAYDRYYAPDRAALAAVTAPATTRAAARAAIIAASKAEPTKYRVGKGEFWDGVTVNGQFLRLGSPADPTVPTLPSLLK